jgi:glycosyltransferase involved in cell wall biosynthesis
MIAIASQHDVWVLTRSNNIARLEQFLRDDPSRSRIHLVGIEASKAARWLKTNRVLPTQLYYQLWQGVAGRVARRLDAQIDFDLIHHVTFASYWARTGVAKLCKPLVWGPVGGGVEVPPGFVRVLGYRGILLEGIRRIVRTVAWRFHRTVRGRAESTVVLAQNAETADKLADFPDVRVVSNATGISIPKPNLAGSRERVIVCVGRLIPWKGGTLAIRAVSRIPADVSIVFYGDGPDRGRIQRLAEKLGVQVRFEGAVPRGRLLDAVARASVLLHVALREEAGLAVGEALAMGTPVVCLDHGGPHELVRSWPDSPSRSVSPTSVDATATDLAQALELFLSADVERRSFPVAARPSYGVQLLQAYEDAVG